MDTSRKKEEWGNVPDFEEIEEFDWKSFERGVQEKLKKVSDDFEVAKTNLVKKIYSAKPSSKVVPMHPHHLKMNEVHPVDGSGEESESTSSGGESSEEERGAEATFVVHQSDHQIAVLEQKVKVFRDKTKTLKEQCKKLQKARSDKNQEIVRLKNLLAEEKEAREFAEENAMYSRHKGFKSLTVKKTSNENDEQRRKRDKALRQLYISGDGADDEQDLFRMQDDNLSYGMQVVREIGRILRKLYPFKRDLEKIKSCFGTSIGSYFTFFQWIILIHIVACIPTILLQFLHVNNLRDKDIAELTKVQGFLLWITQVSSFGNAESEYYAATLVFVAATFFIATLKKWSFEDKRVKTEEIIEQDTGKQTYSKIIINAWDFSLRDTTAVADMKKAIADMINVNLEELVTAKQMKKRSKKAWAILIIRRILGSIVYLAVQISCWILIVFLTTRSGKLETDLAQEYEVLAPYAATMVPTGVSVINGILPPLISLLTKFEQWDDAGFAVKAMVIRLFLAKMMNVVIQLFSFAFLLDPFLFADENLTFGQKNSSIRESVQKVFKRAYSCRAEHVASGLFTLAVTEFVVSKVAGITAPLVQKCWATLSRKPFKKSEFLVAPKMVGLLYFQTLLMMSFPLAPVTMVSSMLMLGLTFKFDKFVLSNFQSKPLVPWNARYAGFFFVKLYFVCVVLFVALTHMYLISASLPKDCQLQDVMPDGTKLCQSDYDEVTKNCTIDLSNTRASYFYNSTANNFTDACPSGGYPSCICSGTLACGPFTNSKYGYEKLYNSVSSIEPFKSILGTAFNSIASLWIALTILLLLLMFRTNSLYTIQAVNNQKDHEHNLEVTNLTKKLRKVEKQLRQLQNIH